MANDIKDILEQILREKNGFLGNYKQNDGYLNVDIYNDLLNKLKFLKK